MVGDNGKPTILPFLSKSNSMTRKRERARIKFNRDETRSKIRQLVVYVVLESIKKGPSDWK